MGSMRQLLLLAGLLVAGAAAQFRELAATGDGSELYFSSSLRLRGSQDPLHPKIFRAGAEGVVLFAARQEEPLDWFSLSNFFQLVLPDVSGDGSLVALNARRICVGGSRCVGPMYYECTLVGGSLTVGRQWPGIIRLSSNGRFALQFPGSIVYTRTQLVDLSSGAATLFPAAAVYYPSGQPRGRVVSSTGVGVLPSADGRQLFLVRNSGGETREAVGIAAAAVIDDQATSVVYESRPTLGAPRRLRLISLAAGKDGVLVENANDNYQPVLSADGRRVLFLSADARTAQLFVVNRDGSGLRQPTADPSGIAEAVLSGDGKVAWLVTGAGRLFRVLVDTGEVTPVIGRTPFLDVPTAEAVPGSLFTLTGRGFADQFVQASVPLPESLGGVRVNLGGTYAPIFSLSPGEIRIQAPWEVIPVPGGNPVRLEFLEPGDNVFEGTTETTLAVALRRPQFERLGWDWAVAHQSFDSLVTARNPARPGEIIHVYMRGLGPVEPLVPTGSPGPVEPLARVRDRAACSLYGPESMDAEVFFAGLAPGFLGVYQVSLRLPSQARGPTMLLTCGVTYTSEVTGELLTVADSVSLPVEGS